MGQIQINSMVDEAQHRLLISEIGRGNFSDWLRSQISLYNQMKFGFKENKIDIMVLKEEIDKKIYERDKLNAEISFKQNLLDKHKNEMKELEIEKLKEQKNKLKSLASCMECGQDFNNVSESSIKNVCKTCFLTLASGQKIEEWTNKNEQS